MKRYGVGLAAAILSLSACSPSDEPPVGDSSVSTSSAPDSTGEMAPPKSSPEAFSASAPEPTATATPSPTESAPDPVTEADPCAADTLSSDLLGYPGGIEVFICEEGWAYAYYVGGDGDVEFVAQQQNGKWINVAGMGSMTCREELTDLGAPSTVVRDFLPCDVMYPSDENTAPVEECVIPTEQFGATFVEPLYNISCAEAADQWYSAADSNPPSFDTPIVTENGWECYVYPNDPTSRVAGACYSPDGSAEFVLNVPG